MPVFSKNLQSLRQIRKGNLLDQPRRAISNGCSLEQVVKRSASFAAPKEWSTREELRASANLQPLWLSQQNRSLSGRASSRIGSSEIFRSVSRLDHAAPRHSPVVSTQDQACDRFEKDLHSNAMIEAAIPRQPVLRYWKASGRRQGQMPESAWNSTTAEKAEAPDAEVKDETEYLCQTVRESVFGAPEDDKEEARERDKADADLLMRVSALRKNDGNGAVSNKVLSPYNSYRSHCNRWAEFRRGMIYGRSTF
ncbi:hypothetical protein KR018_008105 [Drosophila ironensis]|nr:hypothetical protein KR018_008105 [Drosophila ironensis]